MIAAAIAPLAEMCKKPVVRPDDKEQSKLFIRTAREREADEGKSASDQLFGPLAKMPPEPRKKKSGQ
jgi:hypothetical protein